MKNIRTTLLGVSMILTAVGAAVSAFMDSDPTTTLNLEVTFTAIAAGIGLILAREQKTSDKENGN